MIGTVLLIIIVMFFAMNMGASGIAPSFGSVWGARLIARNKAVALYAFFLTLGAFAFGSRVAKTLSAGILDKSHFSFEVALIILLSASLSLFIANLLKVPQSTSWVTVFATVGAAVFFREVNFNTIFRLVGMWLILPAAAYFLSHLLFKIIYPPDFQNLWFYQKVHFWKKQIHWLALASSCYVAFAIGANNVANAVGPLQGADLINPFLGFLLISPLFGLGGWLIGDRTMRTMGEEIVPLGLITSTMVSFITATLLVVASVLGFPQSLVQLNAAAIMAVGSIKHKHVMPAENKLVQKKIFFVWLAAPALSLVLAILILNGIKYAIAI